MRGRTPTGYALLVAGALCHIAAAAFLPFFLYISWRRGEPIRLRRYLPLGALLAALILALKLGYPQAPQATIAASVTGYLGPDSPADQDGVAWSSIAFKTSTDVTVTSRRLYPDNDLSGVSTKRMSALELRHVRQVFAAQQVLQFCVEHFPRCV